jgi:hypothetical protein
MNYTANLTYHVHSNPIFENTTDHPAPLAQHKLQEKEEATWVAYPCPASFFKVYHKFLLFVAGLMTKLFFWDLNQNPASCLLEAFARIRLGCCPVAARTTTPRP